MTSLFYNEPTLGFFHSKLLLVVLAIEKRQCPQLLWKKPIKSMHWNQMKFDVWHVILEIKDMKYLFYYKMNYEAFQNLVLNWFIFCNLNVSTFNHVRPWLEIKKIIAIFFFFKIMNILPLIWLIILMWVHQQSRNMWTLYMIF